MGTHSQCNTTTANGELQRYTFFLSLYGSKNFLEAIFDKHDHGKDNKIGKCVL